MTVLVVRDADTETVDAVVRATSDSESGGNEIDCELQVDRKFSVCPSRISSDEMSDSESLNERGLRAEKIAIGNVVIIAV